MLANVTEQLWIDFGLDITVFLDTIAYWLKKNAANKQPRNFKDGRYWTYNSQEAFQKMFPGWKRETIRRIIRNCVKHDLLIVGNYNAKGYDRTSWFSLTAKGLEYYPSLWHILGDKPDKSDGEPLVDSNPALVDSNPAIPKLLPTSSNNTITTNSSSTSDYSSNHCKECSRGLASHTGADLSAKSGYQKNQTRKESVLLKNSQEVGGVNNNSPKKKSRTGKGSAVELMQYIDVYREVFPNNPQPHAKVISTTLQKTLQTLIKRWPEVDPNGNQLDVSAFRRYLTLLRETAPKFTLLEYTTQNGNKKKNGLETFCRWDTLVKFLENKYS